MAGFSIFGFIFNDYREWEKKWWHRTRQYTCFPWNTEDCCHSGEVRASPARPLFVIGFYFLACYAFRHRIIIL
jgi:hypothetical protein